MESSDRFHPVTESAFDPVYGRCECGGVRYEVIATAAELYHFAEHGHNPGAMWYMPATLEGDSGPGHSAGSEKHIFVASKSPLDTITDDLPQFDNYAPPVLSVTLRKSPGDA